MPQQTTTSIRATTRTATVLRRLWFVPVVFGLLAVQQSVHVGIGFRDPHGKLFGMRAALSAGLLVVAIVFDTLIRARAESTGVWRGALTAFRTRWTSRRLTLVIASLLAYHVTYLEYRNLKSWTALHNSHDSALRDLDRALFAGHDPAQLLHALLGTHVAAHVLAAVYRSFAIVVPVAVVAFTALVPRLSSALTFIASAMWCWVLGTATYYLIPSRGPFAQMPEDFRPLSHTAITATQHEYLAERARFIAHPAAFDALNSVSAFASLHVGFTTLIVLFVRQLGSRWATRLLSAYLAVVIVSTVYFGWHYVSDDIAGLCVGALALWLGRFTVGANAVTHRVHDSPAAVPTATGLHS